MSESYNNVVQKHQTDVLFGPTAAVCHNRLQHHTAAETISASVRIYACSKAAVTINTGSVRI